MLRLVTGSLSFYLNTAGLFRRKFFFEGEAKVFLQRTPSVLPNITLEEMVVFEYILGL